MRTDPAPHAARDPRWLPIALLVFACLAPRLGQASCVNSALFVKSHTWTDTDFDGTTTVGDVLHYTVTFCEPGAGNRRCALSDTLPAGLTLDGPSVVCTPDPGTTPPSNCAMTAPGVVDVDYAGSRMDRDACVTLTFDAVVNAPPTSPICNQAVNDVDPTDLSDNDCHPLVPQPDLEIAKLAASPTVQPGATVPFAITVHNMGTKPLVDGFVSDVFEPCFEPLGAEGTPCDPALVSCSGAGCATTSCVYALGGLGFSLTGLDLEAENRLPGGNDEVVITVTVTAGPTEGTCRNDAETADPDSPSLIAGDSVSIARLPDLEIEKVAVTGTVEPGNVADFTITVRNIGGGPLGSGVVTDILDACFQPLGPAGSPCDPTVVACASPGCAGAICSYTASGFIFSGFALAADDGAPGGDDEVAITVAATAGLVEGACANTAETFDPDTPSLVAVAVVDIALAPVMVLTKNALSPTVIPGGTVDFDIVAANLSLLPISATVVDTLDPCFVPLGAAGAPCDPLLVSCTGLGCGAASCVYGPGGLGFSFSGLALTAADGAPSGDDEVVLRVTVTAGPVEGPCRNTAAGPVPTPPTAEASDSVEIRTASGLCDLMYGDVSFPPRTPSLATLYVQPCAAADVRLDLVHTTTVAAGDLTDDYVGLPGLVLYQLDCGCSQRISLTKNLATGKVQLGVF